MAINANADQAKWQCQKIVGMLCVTELCKQLLAPQCEIWETAKGVCHNKVFKGMMW